MKIEYQMGIVFVIIGIIYYLFSATFSIFGISILYPHLADIFILGIGGYFVGLFSAVEEEDDNNLISVFFEFSALLICILVGFLITLGIYFIFGITTHAYIVLGLSSIFGIILAFLSQRSILDTNEFGALACFTASISIAFGLFVGAGSIAIAFLVPFFITVWILKFIYRVVRLF